MKIQQLNPAIMSESTYIRHGNVGKFMTCRNA